MLASKSPLFGSDLSRSTSGAACVSAISFSRAGDGIADAGLAPISAGADALAVSAVPLTAAGCDPCINQPPAIPTLNQFRDVGFPAGTQLGVRFQEFVPSRQRSRGILLSLPFHDAYVEQRIRILRVVAQRLIELFDRLIDI